jgi:hypothetical protein
LTGWQTLIFDCKTCPAVVKPQTLADSCQLIGIPQSFWPSVCYAGVCMIWCVIQVKAGCPPGDEPIRENPRMSHRAAGAAYNSVVLVTLGVPVSNVGYLWAIQEALTLIISPFIGSASDHCKHPMGRRRFYLAWALASGVLGVLLFSNAYGLGMLMGDAEDQHTAGIVLALLGMIVRGGPRRRARRPCHAFV